MTVVVSKIEVYLKDPERLKYHTKELLLIIADRIDPKSFGEGLDIDCTTGSLIRNLPPMLLKYNFTGFNKKFNLVSVFLLTQEKFLY
jgi:hypothetical protein|tara:strand:+ start:388 stop:648 length:261 start_codon:yes stop_codon:yes gene_type:complete